MKKLTLLATALCLAAPVLSGAASETYYSCGGGYYSDVPRDMQVGRCTAKTSSGLVIKAAEPAKAEPKVMSLAEQQAEINRQIAEQNKKQEEENAKAAATAKAENCKAAQMNKEMVEKTNARNKDQLLPKYEADIAKFCH